ncbi:hypothetical protein CVT26_012278 [Gymnopilus dilepis]|uniref:Uncharacterized protein n=1 Tax=Gymnopilus dilepis TaxID=231916 RepID=A0A409YQB9_9AGAR|nr:hypothetical protein CVT26_012278 [Gymnopilus dilepis]
MAYYGYPNQSQGRRSVQSSHSQIEPWSVQSNQGVNVNPSFPSFHESQPVNHGGYLPATQISFDYEPNFQAAPQSQPQFRNHSAPIGVHRQNYAGQGMIDLSHSLVQDELSKKFDYIINHLWRNVASNGRSFLSVERDKSLPYTLIVPLDSDFRGKVPRFTIRFSVGGHTGPFIVNLARRNSVIDGSTDVAMPAQGWAKTKIKLNWPGFEFTARRIGVVDREGNHLKKVELARIVAAQLYDFLRSVKSGSKSQSICVVDGQVDPSWNVQANVDIDRVRLLAMNYYHDTWVPILGLDAN